MTPIARLQLTALDCPDPDALAEFYRRITGWPVGHRSDQWVQLDSGGGATLAFQRAPDHQPPPWPDPDGAQQLHLDFLVDDLDAGEAAVLDIGARKAAFQPSPARFRVYLDPAGHPFCLVIDDG
ncbi:MAG: VOC family protein [Actinobacteria bacterium]|nr:VOC family protein [Actinomycetota bacterium]